MDKTTKLAVDNTVSTVWDFINANVLHSEAWDKTDPTQKSKAVNNASRVLKRMFPKIYKETIPVEHLAEQCIWMLRVDDMFQKSELGATYIQCDGIAINLAEKDRTLAPFIMQVNGVSEGYGKRRVGSYSLSLADTNRKGW